MATPLLYNSSGSSIVKTQQDLTDLSYVQDVQLVGPGPSFNVASVDDAGFLRVVPSDEGPALLLAELRAIRRLLCELVGEDFELVTDDDQV